MRIRFIAENNRTMRMLGLVLCLLLLAPSEGWVQNRKPMSVIEIVTYNGVDREQFCTREPRPKARSFGTPPSQGTRTRAWLKLLRPSTPA